jgi:hypothetical protein
MTNERLSWRPHLYELVTVANLLVIYALTMSHTQLVLTSLPLSLVTIGLPMLLQAIVAIVVRFAFCAVRGSAGEYFSTIRKPAWILESARYVFTATLMVHVYGWIKLAIPLLHPRLFDQELWNLDRKICFGISPNIFVLNLFNSAVLKAVDYTYGNIFVLGLCVAFGYFVSSPSKRLRVAFMTGHAIMWLSGAWLYVLVPALGPAYRFPEVWLQYSADLHTTQGLQALLWRNYQNVAQMNQGGKPAPISILYGIAAFPSLHVAFQTFIFLWFRRLWTWGEVMFALFVFIIFFGAMITGWHYLIDLIAGMLLAWIVWAVTSRRYRIVRWMHLSRLS